MNLSLIFAGDISLALAEALIGDGYYEEAHQLVLVSLL